MKTLLGPSLLCLALAASAAHAAIPGSLSADIPAAGLQRLSLTAESGRVVIKTSPDDAVHVQLVLHQDEMRFLGVFHWVSDDSARDLPAAKMEQDRKGDTLALSVGYPNGATHSDIKQQWTVSVPARFAVDMRMQAGQGVIDGPAGGVTASLSAGDLEIRVPQGPLHAAVSAGRLHAISDDVKPGAIKVASSFGLAILDFNGKFYGPPEKHGFLSELHFWGNSVKQQGGGGDEIELKAFAGLADLRVGPIGDEKDYRKEFESPFPSS